MANIRGCRAVWLYIPAWDDRLQEGYETFHAWKIFHA